MITTRMLLSAAAAALMLGGPALAADAALMKPIKGFLDATNAGKPVDGYFTASQSVTDEFPPYHWSGAGAVKSWLAGLVALNRKTGAADLVVKMAEPSRAEQAGAHAYVVAPATVDFKQKGKPVHEDGMITCALDHTRSGWKIAAFTWTGSAPPP